MNILPAFCDERLAFRRSIVIHRRFEISRKTPAKARTSELQGLSACRVGDVVVGVVFSTDSIGAE